MHVREHNPEPSNPLGMDGVEFIEFATSQSVRFLVGKVSRRSLPVRSKRAATQ